MSDSTRAGPSHSRSHTTGFIGWESLPLLAEVSQHQYLYTSKDIPTSTTPSHLSITEADHGIAPAGDPVDLGTNGTPGSSFRSANQQQERIVSRSRLVALYHNYNPQMVLENRGSTARDHLASERTFLAYVRTSLGLASAGVALVQLLTTNTSGGDASKRVQKYAQPLGASTIIVALTVLGIAVYRYFCIQVALPNNMFPVALSVVFITFSLSAVVAVVFALLAGI